ncbi:tRNA (adenosine(37)-N6)-dimethylallyltransferase MiaA [Candidatus Uhrbacteria bacterium]|nr:tRNA (adenosine(37)-N6)-dimethylallyltransferase MiaA [Candidatus Uhrbacteria bacterium]
MPKVVVVVGPTGSGKTDLALRIARVFDGELIAADSRTVYRGMDIGTAKSKEPHHLVNVRNPNEPYSVSEFKADAERLIREITQRGKLPIVVGGTGLYIRALVDNLTIPEIPAQPKLRESFEKKSNRALLTLLRTLDPVTVKTIDRKNKRRIIRALEVCIFTGQPFSALRVTGEPLFDFLEIGIQRTRTALYRRIDQRIRAMFRAGLVTEVQRLLARYGPGIEPLRGIIYRDVVEWLQKQIQSTSSTSPYFHGRENTVRSLRGLQQCIMYANHRYARHQLMWFKRDQRIHWVRTVRQTERLVREFLAPSPEGKGRLGGVTSDL